MRPIPKNLKEEMKLDPFYQRCIRSREMNCGGRITFEHAIIYAGKQVNEKWAILPVCEYHHAVNDYQDCGKIDKRLHEWVALNRMTIKDERKYPKFDWAKRRDYLNRIYGKCDLTNIGKGV